MARRECTMRTLIRVSVVLVGLMFPASSVLGQAYFLGVGDLPGGGVGSQANAVSADGSTVVGGSSSANSYADYAYEAFRWTATGGMEGLGDLPGGHFSSNGLAISANGAVVVGRSHSADGDRAYRWTPQNGMVSLGVLAPGETSSAHGASADAASGLADSMSGSRDAPPPRGQGHGRT